MNNSVSIHDARAGQQLSAHVLDEHGHILVSQGATLTSSLIRKLVERGIQTLNITAKQAAPPDPMEDPQVTEEVHAKAESTRRLLEDKRKLYVSEAGKLIDSGYPLTSKEFLTLARQLDIIIEYMMRYRGVEAAKVPGRDHSE